MTADQKLLTDAIITHKYDESFVAYLHAAIGEKLNAKQAVDVAEEAFKRYPKIEVEPQEDDAEVLLGGTKADVNESGEPRYEEVRRQVRGLLESFDESKVKRDHGKFSETGGVSGQAGVKDKTITVHKPAIARMPETEEEAIALASAARDCIVGSSERAENGQCLTAAEDLKSLHPDIQVWRGNYQGDIGDAESAEHQIVKAGKFFIDVTSDQFADGDPVRVFTQDEIDSGFMYEYAGFTRAKATEERYAETKPRTVIAKTMLDYEHGDKLALKENRNA